MALPIVKEYIKNLAKSVGYAAVDTTKMQAPAFKDFLETNEELFSDVYHGIRDITGTIDKAKKIVMDSQIYKTGDLALHNAWEDIKTGKIYNKERENAVEDAAVDNMMGSDFDFGATESSDGTGESKSKKEDISDGDKAIVSAVDSSMKASTIATGTAIASTGKYIATTNKAIANMQLAAQGKMLNLMSSGFGSITSGFQSLHSTISEGLKVQIDNQKTYFETTTKLIQEQNAMMKEMLEMQRGIYKKEAAKEKEGKGNTYEDVVTASGAPNLKAYGNAIWTNFKDIINEQTGGMGSMLNEDMLKALAANPLGGIAEFVVAGLMGNALKTNLKNFDKTLGNSFGNLISRFNYEGARDDSGITGFISKVFGLKSSIKSSIRTDQYEKGSVPWSGKDSMSLQVVIPSYLSRIESALTGKKARLFDFDKGVFTLKEDTEKRFISQNKQYARSATSDVRGDVEKQLSVFGFDYEIQKNLKNYLDNAFEQIYSDYGQFNAHDKTIVNRYKGNFNGNEELTKLFIKAMQNVDRDKRMQMAPEVMSQRQAQDQMMKRIEKEGTNPFINLYREFAAQNGSDPELKIWGKGSYKEGKIKDKISSIAEGRIDKVTDAFKKTIFDYLRDISLTLRNIRELNAAGFAYGNSGGDTVDESNITINNMTKADIFAMPTDNKAQRMRRARFISMYNRRVAQARASQMASSSENSNAFWNAYNRNNSERMMGDKRRKTPTQENIDYENNQRASNIKRVEEKLRSGDLKLKFDGDNLGHAQGILDIMRKIKDAKNEETLNTQYNELAKLLHTRADRAKELANTLMGVNEGEQVELDENGKPVKRKREIGRFKVDEGGIVDKLMTAGGVMEKVKVIQDELASLVTRPTDALAGVIAKADEHIYDFFFSKDANETDDQGNRITGMFGYMKNELKKEFKHFNKWIDEEILQKLKDKFGGETAWEAAGNAIEKYTGFNPYKGALTLKDKIIGAKGEDGEREGGLLSGFLNKINEDVQNTLLNLRESVEEKINQPPKEEDETPSSSSSSPTPAPTPAPLTMEEIIQAHWSRDEERTKKEHADSLAELRAARHNMRKFDDKVINQSKKDRAHQLFELGGYDMVDHGLDFDTSEALTSIEKNVKRINKLKESDLRRYNDGTKYTINSALVKVQRILNNYPDSCTNVQTQKLRPLLDVVVEDLDTEIKSGRLPYIIQKEILKIVSKFDDAEKVKLSDEESKKIDDKYQSMKNTAKSDIAALEVQVEETKKKAEWFRKQRKLEAELKKHQDQIKALIEEGKQRAAAISRLDAQRNSGELTLEQYQIARKREDAKWTNPSELRDHQVSEDNLKNKISEAQRDREAEGDYEIKNLITDSRIGSREDLNNLIANGQFATGGVVPKTGLYFLSKDEQVIPTSHMEEDAARENALIAKLRKQYPNFNFEGQYAYGTGNPQPIFSDDTLKEHRYKEGEDGWWYNDLSQTYTKNIDGKQLLREVTTRNDIDSKNTERFQEVPGDDGVTRLVDTETKETFVNVDGKWLRESEITKASQLKKGSTGNILGSLTRTGLGGAFNWITDKMKYDPEKDGNDKPMSRQAMDVLRDGFSAVTENFLYGSDPKKTKEKLEQVKKETINAMPYAVSGGMMGFIPGLVMGAPFLGALVGAGLNVANKSDTMSDWLFGARDENGERKDDGFISKDTQDMLKKYMPDVKLFGSIGSIAGLLTGLGPIPGLMIGGAAAFVKNNEEASNVLFGKDGLIGPHAKEKLKKAAPQIFAGAGTGALFGLLGGSLPVFGPLGLLGGLAAGAGLGLISTTDSFKDAILGPKDKEGNRHGGLVGSIRDAITDPIRGLGNKISGAFTRYIKEDLVGPVARSVAPFTKVLQLGVNKMFSAIGSAFSVGINKVLTPIKDYGMSLMQAALQRTPLGRWLGKAGGFLKNGVAGIISAPSKLIGMAGDWTRQRLIQTGNAGDFMSSDEQLSFMDDRGIDGYKYKEMNQKLAGMNSMELERQLGNIDMMLDSNRNIEDERKKESSRFNSEIKANHHILPIERKKLIKLVKDGKIEEAHEYVMGLRLPQDEKRSIIESIEGHTNRMSDIDNFGDSSAQTEDMYSKLSESFGFEVNESNIHKLRAQLKTDIRSAKTDEEDIGTESEELKAQLDSNSELKMQTDLLTEIRDRLDALRGIQSGDLSRLKSSQRMAYDMQRDSTSWYRDNYDKAIDADSNTVNETVMAAFTRGRNLSEEDIAEYVVSDENRDILVNNSRNPNTPEKAERIRRLGEVNKLNLTPGQINLLIGTPDKEFKALIKTFELGFNLKEDDIVAILKCNRQLGGDRASTNLNILLDNNVPIYRLTDENGDAQKFLAVRKEVLDNMIRIRDEYLPDADAEALYEVYARHKNGLLSDANTYADVNRILDRELGENFRRGMERRTTNASIGRGENGDQERGENTAGSASRLFDAVHSVDNIGRFVHGTDITGTISEAIANRPVVNVGSHAFGGLAKAGLNILSKGEQIVSTAKSGIDTVRNSAVFKGAKSVASGIYKAGKFVNNLVSNPTGTAADAVSSGYSALKRTLEKKAGENGEEGENKGEKVVNTDYGPMIYKKSMSGDYTLANTKDNVNIKNAIASRDNTQSSILSVLEEIRDNTKIKSSTPGEEKSGGGMGLLGMIGALATGIKKLFDSSLKIGKGIYKGIKGIFNLGKTFGKTAIKFFGKLLTKIGLSSAAEKLGGLGGDKDKSSGSKIKGGGRRVARFGRGVYGLGNPLIGLAGLNSTIGTGFDLFSTGDDSYDDDFDDVELGDFSDESTGDYEDTDSESDFVDYAAKGLGVAEAVNIASDANDVRELWKKNENNPNRTGTPNTPDPNNRPGIFESAKQKVQAGIDWGTDKLRSAGQAVKDTASSAWNSVKNSSVGKAVGGYIEQVKDQVIDKMKSVANFIVDKAPKISADKMKAFFDKILSRVIKPEKLSKIAEKIAIKAGFNSAEAAAGAGTFGVGTAVLATAEIAFWFSQGVTNAAENFDLEDGVEPTAGMRFISGIAEAFCGCTPVGYVLEGSDIIAIGKETLGEVLGASDKVATDLNKAIKTAQSEQAGMAAGVQSDYFKAENSAAKEESGDWFSSMKNSIANSYLGRKAAGAVGWAKEKLSSVASGVKSFFGFGKLGPADPTYGMGDFYSQKDPSVANIPFNVSGDTQKQTIGDSACGPAALMNVASALGKDKFGRGSGDLAKASMDALAYKEKDGGTKPGYFNAEANKLGFSTKKISVSSVDSELDKGHPVIMMGQDPSASMGMGKYGRGGPVYGPYPHYIAVTGKDDQGNYIVQDSEGTPNQRVSGKYIKDHSSLAMAGMGKWGRGSAVDEDPPFGSIAATLAKSVGSNHPELFWAQMMFETGGPDNVKESKWQAEDHNYGGFTWYPGMGEEYKGGERKEGGFYAKFKSDAEYAEKAFNKVYKKYKDALAKAETPEEFARVLKENEYYESSEAEYAAGLKALLNGKYKDKLGNLGGMAGNISTDSNSGNSSTQGNTETKNYSGFFGGLRRIYDAFGSIFSFGSSNTGGANGGKPGSAAASPGGGSGTETQGQLTGDGNTMHIDAQTGGNCTIEATRAMVKAYLDRDEPKRNEQFSWWNPTLESDLSGKWVNFGNSATDKTNFENYIANHFASKPGNPLFLYQTGGDGRNGSHPINKGQGDHATVIGRKLSNGKYEHYDSAGGVVKEFDLGDIFDPSARGGKQGMQPGEGNSIVEPGIDPSRPITNWQGGTPTAEAGKGKWGKGKWGRGELLDRLRSTGSIWSNSGNKEEESYKMNKSYDFSDVSGVDPDSNKYSIPYLVKKYNLQFDGSGNLNGVDIPEYNLINGTESNTVKYAKQRAQIEYYAKNAYGTGKWGRGEQASVPFVDKISKKFKINRGLDANAEEYDGIQRDVKGEKKVFAQKFGTGKWGRGSLTPEGIYQYLINKGFSSNAAAGIMGNLQQESGFRSTAVQSSTGAPIDSDTMTIDGNTGYGLAQWTYITRQKGLHEFAQSRGVADSDAEMQLDYLIQELGSDNIAKLNAAGSPSEAARIFHTDFEKSADDESGVQRRANYAEEIFKNQGKGIAVDGKAQPGNGGNNGGNNNANKSSGFSFLDKIAEAAEGVAGKLKQQLAKAFGNVKIPESFKKAYSSIFGGNFDLLGSLFGGSSSASASPGGGGGGATSEGIKSASQWAESVLNKAQDSKNPPYWYGTSGCTAFAKAYLDKAGVSHPDFDMYVPTMYSNAKAHGTLKGPDQAGAEGDVAIVRDDGSGEPCHAIIADGKGGYWGNSSGRHMIVHSNSITGDYNKLWGYLPTGSGSGTVSNDKLNRSDKDQHDDAGPTDGMGKWGRGKWGRGELLDRLRSTGSIWSKTGNSEEESYKRHKSYDFSDVSGVDPDGNKYSIPYLVKKYNLQFDDMGNLKGVDIPEYNLINGTESKAVKYSKQRAQIQYYAKNVYGTKWGRGELLNRLRATGSIWSGSGRAEELYKRHKSYDFSDVSGVDPDGNKYSIPYLVKKYNLQFDDMGNLKGVDIPEYNRINGTESNTVKYAKQRAQIEYYAKNAYGTGKWGRGSEADSLDSKYLNDNIPSYNKIDLKNDSKTVIEAKKKAIDAWYATQNKGPLHDDRLEKARDASEGTDNIKLTSNDDRATLRKKTFLNTMINEIPSYNKIDYKNDSKNVIEAKMKAINKSRSSKWGRGTDIDSKYFNENIPEYNKIDLEKDSKTVIAAKMKAIDAWYAKQNNPLNDTMVSKSKTFPGYTLDDIPEYNRIDYKNDSKTVIEAKLKAINKMRASNWGRGTDIDSKYFNENIPSYNQIDLENDSKTVIAAKMKAIDAWYAKQNTNSLQDKIGSIGDNNVDLDDDIPEYNRIDYKNDSKTVIEAKLRAIHKMRASKWGRGSDIDSKYFNENIPEYNKIDLENDSKTVIAAKMKAIDAWYAKQNTPLQDKIGVTGDNEIVLDDDIPEYNRIDYKNDSKTVIAAKMKAIRRMRASNWGRGTDIDSKYFNENIPSYNQIDLENDSKTVIAAKMKAIDAWYANQNTPLQDKIGATVSKGDNVNDDDIPEYNRIDYKNDSKTVIEAKLKAINKMRAQNNNPLHDMMISKSKTFPGYISNDIPEYNRIDYKNDSITVQRAKAMAQRKAGADRLHFKHGTGKGGIFGYINDKILGTAKDFIFGKKKQDPLSEKITPAENVEVTKPESNKVTNEDPRVTKLKEIARTIPKGFWDKYPYNRPDDWNKLNLTVDELKVNKMLKLWEREKATNPNWETDYTGVEDIPETIYTDATATEVEGSEELPLAPNGMKYEKNDIDYLLNNGYSMEDALKFLATDKKYTTKVENKTSSSEDAAAKEAEEEEKARKEKEEYEAKQPGMAKLFGWDSHKQLEKYYEEKDKAEKLKAEEEKKAKETETKAVSNVEKLKKEQEKTKELKAEQEAQKVAENQAKETEAAKAEQTNAAAASISGENYQEKIIGLLTAAVQYLSIIAGNGGNGGEKYSDKPQNMTKMKSDLKDIINGTSNIGGVSDLIGGSDMSSIMKTLNLVATR